jgi:protein-L-isoaspartate(D-aspartate) O-methyltransferase
LRRAQALIQSLELYNVYFRLSGDRLGWPEKAPFDGILLTAAPRQVPEQLTDQLGVGGKLLAPIGESGNQELVMVERGPHGFNERRLGSVSFVPLIVGME